MITDGYIDGTCKTSVWSIFFFISSFSSFLSRVQIVSFPCLAFPFISFSFFSSSLCTIMCRSWSEGLIVWCWHSHPPPLLCRCNRSFELQLPSCRNTVSKLQSQRDAPSKRPRIPTQVIPEWQIPSRQRRREGKQGQRQRQNRPLRDFDLPDMGEFKLNHT